MNKETKEFVINQITFILKIFCIIIGFTFLTGMVCYFIDADGVRSVRTMFSAAILAVFYGIWATLRRMEII